MQQKYKNLLIGIGLLGLGFISLYFGMMFSFIISTLGGILNLIGFLHLSMLKDADR